MLLIALSLPEPGPLTCTSTSLTPNSLAFLAALSAATPAANGVDFFELHTHTFSGADLTSKEVVFHLLDKKVTYIRGELKDLAYSVIPAIDVFYN